MLCAYLGINGLEFVYIHFQFLSIDSEHLPVPDYDMVDTAVSQYCSYSSWLQKLVWLHHVNCCTLSLSLSLSPFQRLLESLNSSDDADISHESMIQPGVGGAVVPLSLSSSVDPLVSPTEQPSPNKPSELV